VVLSLQRATYSTKSTVVGYDGTKIQWPATAVHNRMKGYDSTKDMRGLRQYTIEWMATTVPSIRLLRRYEII